MNKSQTNKYAETLIFNKQEDSFIDAKSGALKDALEGFA